MTNKKFLAKINRQYQVRLNAEDALPFEHTTGDYIHAKNNSNSINAQFHSEDFLNKIYTIRINGTLYEISLLDELDLLIDELGLSVKSTSVEDKLIAPMPGLIVEVLAGPGDSVREGQALVVLEAMKMENTLAAPTDGIVKSVNIKASDAVDKGTVLIEFKKNEENK